MPRKWVASKGIRSSVRFRHDLNLRRWLRHAKIIRTAVYSSVLSFVLTHCFVNFFFTQTCFPDRFERSRRPRRLPHHHEMPRSDWNEDLAAPTRRYEERRWYATDNDSGAANGCRRHATENGHVHRPETRATNHDASLYALHVGQPTQHVFHQCHYNGHDKSPIRDFYHGSNVFQSARCGPANSEARFPRA